MVQLAYMAIYLLDLGHGVDGVVRRHRRHRRRGCGPRWPCGVLRVLEVEGHGEVGRRRGRGRRRSGVGELRGRGGRRNGLRRHVAASGSAEGHGDASGVWRDRIAGALCWLRGWTVA